MLSEGLFWLALAATTYPAWRIFRDMGDITQIFMKVDRATILDTIRWERRLIAMAVAGIAIMSLQYFAFDAGRALAYWPSMAAFVVMLGFPLLWIHIGLRNQQHSACFYSIAEAKTRVRPETSVIVLTHDGKARAHPDYEVWRPHLIGNEQGLAGENVILTYCALTHLGQGFKAEIDGRPLELEVLAQTGNNLVMRDNTTMEPIQQLHGFRACDGASGAGMAHWPTFRMTFRAFEKAYPNGTVFLNRIQPFTKHPFLWLFDHFVDALFYIVITEHDRSPKPAMPTIGTPDPRLPPKTYVWGFNVGDDYVAYTEDFVRCNGPLNTVVGGRAIVAAYDEDYESLGIWYNDSGSDVTQIDFHGDSEQGRLKRVETVRAGAYWCVWAHYFPTTEINRSNINTQSEAA